MNSDTLQTLIRSEKGSVLSEKEKGSEKGSVQTFDTNSLAQGLQEARPVCVVLENGVRAGPHGSSGGKSPRDIAL